MLIILLSLPVFVNQISGYSVWLPVQVRKEPVKAAHHKGHYGPWGKCPTYQGHCTPSQQTKDGQPWPK